MGSPTVWTDFGGKLLSLVPLTRSAGPCSGSRNSMSPRPIRSGELRSPILLISAPLPPPRRSFMLQTILSTSRKPAGHRPPPPAEEVSRHLAQVYFRTREADYFLQEMRENTASPLADDGAAILSRAVQAYDRSDSKGADEYLKTADEIVNALEEPGPGRESRARTAPPMKP